MKKTEMLKKNYQFKNVLSKGKFYRDNETEIVILKNNKNKNFLGIAIGTKNGKAFQRNRAKRIVRESYKNIENNIKEGYSIIILINKKFDLKNINYNSIFNSMKNIFDKAKIGKEEEEK